MFRILDEYKPYGHWLLRTALALVFIVHGLANIMDSTGFAAGLHVPYVVGIVLALMEIGGGVLVIMGGFAEDWMTRFGALLLLPVVLVTIFTVHLGSSGLSLARAHIVGGMELSIVLFLIALFVLLKGNKA